MSTPEYCQKNCYYCNKVIKGRRREYDNAPTSYWWEQHKCSKNPKKE